MIILVLSIGQSQLEPSVHSYRQFNSFHTMASPRKRKSASVKAQAESGDEQFEEPLPKRTKGCDRKSCQVTYTDPAPFCFCHATER